MAFNKPVVARIEAISELANQRSKKRCEYLNAAFWFPQKLRFMIILSRGCFVPRNDEKVQYFIPPGTPHQRFPLNRKAAIVFWRWIVFLISAVL